MDSRLNYTVISLAVLLAFVVVVLGAYTRLTHAGLGCPDWPGCYGQVVVPHTPHMLTQAQRAFPSVPMESRKAWTEMVHRYGAGLLGILILVIAIMALVSYKKNYHPLGVPLFLLGLLVFQVMLGRWTVTLKLFPLVVMGHLLGGLAILALLWWLRLRTANRYKYSIPSSAKQFRLLAMLSMVVVVMQIALGGWVSSNYAGLACIGFPACNGQLIPHLNLSAAFQLFNPQGINFQGGVLDSSARVTIQVLHRLGAFVTAGFISVLSIWIIKRTKSEHLKKLAILLLTLLVVQFTLGVLNVTQLLPLAIAVAHNAVAALLLLVLATINYNLFADRGKL